MYVTLLQGALLLVLFNVSHAVEHLLTDRAQGNLASLLEKAPQTATLLQATADGQPDFARKQSVRAEDVSVGSLMLVRPGEQVMPSPCPEPPHLLLSSLCCAYEIASFGCRHADVLLRPHCHQRSWCRGGGLTRAGHAGGSGWANCVRRGQREHGAHHRRGCARQEGSRGRAALWSQGGGWGPGRPGQPPGFRVHHRPHRPAEPAGQGPQHLSMQSCGA